MPSQPKIAFAEYTPRTHGTATLDAAIEEIRRELTVRKRIYDTWYEKASITFAEGDSRMRGLMGALNLLNEMLLALPGDHVAKAPGEQAF